MSCSSCFCSKNKCRTTIIDSPDDPSTITLANYDPKVKDSFVIDSFGSTVVTTGIGSNSDSIVEKSEYNVYDLGINEKISKDETLIFNTMKLNFIGIEYTQPLIPLGNMNLQFGIYKLVDKGSLQTGNPATYDDNSEVIVKSDIINFSNTTKTGFFDLKFDKNITIKGNDSEYYFLEIVADIGTNIDMVHLQGISEATGILGHRYRAQYTGNLPMPDVLAGENLGAGGATSDPGVSETTCPYINLYFDYKQFC